MPSVAFCTPVIGAHWSHQHYRAEQCARHPSGKDGEGSRLQRNINNIEVRSFVLNAAPLALKAPRLPLGSPPCDNLFQRRDAPRLILPDAGVRDRFRLRIA